jgi:hypothetical protein
VKLISVRSTATSHTSVAISVPCRVGVRPRARHRHQVVVDSGERGDVVGARPVQAERPAHDDRAGAAGQVERGARLPVQDRRQARLRAAPPSDLEDVGGVVELGHETEVEHVRSGHVDRPAYRDAERPAQPRPGN